MKKQNLLLLTLFVLLLCNAFLVWRSFNSPQIPSTDGHHQGPPPGEGGPRRAIIRKLHFDEQQVQAYEDLIRAHRASLHEINRETIALKKELYQSLLRPVNSDSLIDLISLQQRKVEKVNLNHFQAIRQLCRPDQQAYFQQLVSELGQLFNEHHPPPPRPE